MYTVKNKKRVLDASDDKRYIIQNSNDNLAWGHYKINVQHKILLYLKKKIKELFLNCI